MPALQPQRIGRFMEIDENGFVIPDVHFSYISSSYLPIIDEVTQHLVDQPSVRAIYVRGSAPRGLAQPGYSDIDFVLVTTEEHEGINTICEQLNASCKIKYPFVRSLEFAVLPPQKLNEILPFHTRPFMHMLLKTQGLFLAGQDVTTNILPFKPDTNMARHAYHLNENLTKYNGWRAQNDGNIVQDRQWLARRIVRAGLEITLTRQTSYTRDLYLCYEVFSQFYPAYKETMYRMLENAINGTEDFVQYQDFISFLQQEAEEHLKS